MKNCIQCGTSFHHLNSDHCHQCLIDDQMFDETEECGQCDGSGYWYHCIDGCCVNAEEGCNLCARRCDFCNPFKPTPEQAKERTDLGQILSAAIEKAKEK